MEPAGVLDDVVTIAERAGEVILEVYARSEVGARQKADRSPLTDADVAANRTIVAGLESLGPGYPILSEETVLAPYEERARWTRFWLVDPLDGTKDFLKRNGEFTVNIALVEDGVPILGVVHAPVAKTTYAAARNAGAERRASSGRTRIRAGDWRVSPFRVVASRSHAGPLTPRFLERLPPHELISIGSSLKFCLLAEGTAALYPRFGPTSEWDVAAADAVVREAGGSVTDLRGEPLRYNKRNILNPWFMVTGSPPFPWQPLVADIAVEETG